MKICKGCGSSIDDSAIFCSVCGARQGERRSPFGTSGERPTYSTSDTRGSIWVAILSFLIPLAGLVLWYSWRFTRPGQADSAAKGALASVCLGTPVAGLIVWLIWRESHRELAVVAGIAAIVGVALTTVFSVLSALLTMFDVTLFGYTVPEILEFFYYLS